MSVTLQPLLAVVRLALIGRMVSAALPRAKGKQVIDGSSSFSYQLLPSTFLGKKAVVVAALYYLVFESWWGEGSGEEEMMMMLPPSKLSLLAVVD